MGNPDRGADTYANGYSYTNCHSHGYGNVYAYTNTDSYLHAYANANGYSNSHGYSYVHAYTNTDSYLHAYANANGYSNTNGYSYAHIYSNSYGYSYADSYVHADANCYSNTYADLRPGRLAIGSAPASGPLCYPGRFGMDNMLYIAGGQSADATPILYNQVSRYNPTTNTWSNVAPLPVPLRQGTTGAANGKI